MPARMPVVFIPHGGGPWPFVEMGLPQQEVKNLADYLRSVRDLPPEPPKALLVVSAHWEEDVPSVMTSPAPPMLFDYYGFPEASYQLSWPAPGSPGLAARARGLLDEAGIPNGEDASRGFDHGTFVPLMLTYPKAEVPAIQLSLRRGLDPAQHIEIGRALQPLRDEGVFIVASGMTFHNLRAMRHPSAPAISEAFDAWLSVKSHGVRRSEIYGHDQIRALRCAQPFSFAAEAANVIPSFAFRSAAACDSRTSL